MRIVHADIDLAAIALGAFKIVIVEADDDDTGLHGRADAFIGMHPTRKMATAMPSTPAAVALDQVVLANRIVVGVLHVEIDASARAASSRPSPRG